MILVRIQNQEIMMHPMLKLLASNRKKGVFRAEALPGYDEATIYLYDMIVNSDIEAEYWGGVSPQAFIKALNEITAPTIHLRINSPGGSVFAARAIEQAIREHSSTIIAHVDGLAASAASFLIMAADSVEMSPGSFIMIHKAWTFSYGNADDMIKTAGLLEQIDGSLVKTYAVATGQAENEISDWMAAETWFDAEKSVELGFADKVSDGSNSNSTKNSKHQSWDLSAFAHTPNQISDVELVKAPDKDLKSKTQENSTVDRDSLIRATRVLTLSA